MFSTNLKGREGTNGFQSNGSNKQLTLKSLKQLVPESSVKLIGSYLQVNIFQIAYSKFYMNNSRAEVYLEPCQTSTMELFCENSWQLKAVIFAKKAPSYIFEWVLNTLLQGSSSFLHIETFSVIDVAGVLPLVKHTKNNIFSISSINSKCLTLDDVGLLISVKRNSNFSATLRAEILRNLRKFRVGAWVKLLQKSVARVKVNYKKNSRQKNL